MHKTIFFVIASLLIVSSWACPPIDDVEDANWVTVIGREDVRGNNTGIVKAYMTADYDVVMTVRNGYEEPRDFTLVFMCGRLELGEVTLRGLLPMHNYELEFQCATFMHFPVMETIEGNVQLRETECRWVLESHDPDDYYSPRVYSNLFFNQIARNENKSAFETLAFSVLLCGAVMILVFMCCCAGAS